MEKAKKTGFRLNLGEPLATQLDEFCDRNYRKKTEVIREALATYFENWAADQEGKNRNQ
jgi:metal-responsive CopG/Arc/MetJ family transcriptional regulator